MTSEYAILPVRAKKNRPHLHKWVCAICGRMRGHTMSNRG